MFDGSGTTITQTYDAAGNPTNMLTYHNWVDVATYAGAADGNTVRWTAGFGPQLPGYKLPAGTYRLRVDSLANTGANGSAEPPAGNNGQAHKGYSVRGAGPGRQPLRQLHDRCLERHDDLHPDRRLLRLLPDLRLPDRARLRGPDGDIDIYDSGDITSGTLDLYLVDPSNNVARPTAPATVAVYNLGSSRATNPGTVVSPPLTDPTQAFAEPTSAGTKHFDGQWLHFEVPIPTTYSPGANPNNWWWKIRYLITPAGTAPTPSRSPSA